jgi:hypothetical protein
MGTGLDGKERCFGGRAAGRLSGGVTDALGKVLGSAIITVKIKLRGQRVKGKG